MPAGKAMAMAAMPTAVIVGMGFTASLAVADNNKVAASPTETMNAEDYQACVEALKADKDKSSQSPSPSASASAPESAKESTPSPSATATGSGEESSPDKADQDKAGQGTAGRDEAASGTSSSDKAAPGTSSSSDSGSDDKGGTAASGSGGGAASTTPSPSATEKKDGGLLGAIGDAIGDTVDGIGNVLTGGKSGSGAASSPSASPTPSASASPSASTGASGSDQGGSAGSGGKSATDTVKDTADKAAGTVKDTVDGVTDTASKAAEDAKQKAEDAKEKAGEATSSPSPSPSASASVDPEECPAATDAEGGVDNKIPLPDDPWYLNASSLTLKGAHYKGIVEVRTANGTVKKVLKYVISAGTDIGDLHQTVKDKLSGKTYHVQAAKGSTSTITDGDTVMYTESISGNLLGLIPITFSPDSPPPLDIPLIYFTKVKVVQAGQFGGTLKVPGLHQYTTDGV
ncbi:CsbD family protein [Streptomyces sp. NPDC007070]|uniref:CsbD family protein n=1 Tax=Streptomyces sp. NPDC007070 TaxID=3154312 RepID=UPI0033DE1CE7